MAAVNLLRSMRATLGEDSLLVIGFDRIRTESALVCGYDDTQGGTADFNLNLARRIKRELGVSLSLESLAHKAIRDEGRARIEMHIEAPRPIGFNVCGRHFTMEAGETIHTENSYKYDPRIAGTLLLARGWELLHSFGDAENTKG